MSGDAEKPRVAETVGLAWSGDHAAAPQYTSRFGEWEARASVRTKPARAMLPGSSEGLLFPPELIPVLNHELVLERGPEFEQAVSAHALCQYLHYTTVLEQITVIPVASTIALGRLGLDVSEIMRSDALKICTDEAWHAQFSHDFMRSVAYAYRLDGGGRTEPEFVRRLDAVRSTAHPAILSVIDYVFAIVSETLVSALLSSIPRDQRIAGPVRAVVADHAADEGRHHVYFRSFLKTIWPRLSARQRQLVGRVVPDIINAYLETDRAASAAMLRAAGMDARGVLTVLAETGGADAASRAGIATAAEATVRVFRGVGALEDQGTLECFAAAGLLPDVGAAPILRGV